MTDDDLPQRLTDAEAARALAGGRHQVIGLLVPDLDTSYIG